MSLFGPPNAYGYVEPTKHAANTDPDTSHEAAINMEVSGKLNRHCEIVLGIIRRSSYAGTSAAMRCSSVNAWLCAAAGSKPGMRDEVFGQDGADVIVERGREVEMQKKHGVAVVIPGAPPPSEETVTPPAEEVTNK